MLSIIDLKKYIPHILIIILLAGCVILWQRGVAKQKVIDEQASILKVAKDVAEIEERLEALKKREAELYPELAKKMKLLEQADGQIAKKRKELNDAKKNDVAKQVDKMDLNNLSNELRTMGYPNTVTGQ